MTQPANQTPPITDSRDVRVRMRVAGNPSEAPDRPTPTEATTYARAISRDALIRPRTAARNFVLLHGGEARGVAADGWGLNESPPAAGWAWRNAFPAKGERSNVAAWVGATTAGLFRALVITVLWLGALAVATRIRAAVGLVLTVCVILAGLIAGWTN